MMQSYILIVRVQISGMEWTFTSEPMEELWADILLREFISRTPFEVLRARKVPAKTSIVDTEKPL